MARRSSKPGVTVRKKQLQETGSGELKIGKRGVYLITGTRKVKSFRLVGWDEITKRLQS